MLHPIRIMLSLENEDSRIVAVLHDVVEDTDVELVDLQSEGFSIQVLDALSLLTHVDGVDYDEYVERLSHNPIAREVKLADLKDNMNIRRLSKIRDKDLERLRKYHRVWQKLKAPDVSDKLPH